MDMYKRILVAVDGSETARSAFDAALGLAQVMHATLRPYYVIDNALIYFDAPGYDPSLLRNQMIEQGDALASELNAAMREKQVDGEMLTGEVTSSGDVPGLVLNAAREFDADLIVMGTRGRRGVQRLILGSVAERCVRQSTVPVLLIPAAAVTAGADTQ